MKRDIRIIGLDLDGTVLNGKKELTPRVKQAIEKAIQAGVVVLPATGRPYNTIPEEILAIEGIRYALTANGANLYDRHTQKMIYTDHFDRETALSVLADAGRYYSLITVLANGQGSADEKNMDAIIQTLPPVLVEYLKTFRQPVADLEKMVEASEYPVEKFSIHYPEFEIREEARKHFQSRKDICVSSSLESNLELNTPTANKGAALLALGELLGYEKSQIMAIGDSFNDLDMLKTVGYGVAMGNASDEVKAVADWITLSCEQDGVAHAIEQVLPIAD